MAYLTRRLLQAALLLIGVSMLTFLLSTLAPGNYFDEMRLNPQISPETVAALRAQYRLNQPLAVRYAGWVKSLLRGEMGFSFAYGAPVGPLLWVRARNTLLLTVTATTLAWILALLLGAWSAAKRRRLTDHIITGATSVMMVLPDLAVALGLLLVAVRTGWFPTGGMMSLDAENLSTFDKVKDLTRHMALPVLALIIAALPMLVRHVRASVAEALNASYMRSAVGHGLRGRTLVYVYALRGAAIPLLSLFGFSIGALLSGSLIVEVVMSWPGLGPLLLEAILARDLYVVIGGVFCSTLFLLAGNFLADVLQYWADPRIRVQAER